MEQQNPKKNQKKKPALFRFLAKNRLLDATELPLHHSL